MSKEKSIWKKLRSSRLMKVIVILIIFFGLVVLMDRVVMPAYVHLGDEMQMPEVVEMNVGEARDFLEKQGFDVIIADSVYDAYLAKGTVVEQNPLSYSTVKKGRNVYLTVSIGEKPIIMPNLFNKSPRQAELLLQQHGLELDSKFYDYSDISPEGVVIGQSYPQGQKIKKGANISITISLGAMPQRRVIPGLVGQSLGAAKKQLQVLGIEKIQIDYEEKENMLPETVLSQSIPAGEQVGRQDSIRLTVSKIKQIDEPEE